MDKDLQVRRFTDEILNRIKISFENHRRRIDKQNAQRSGGSMKSQATQSFYSPMNNIIQNLQNLQRLVHKSQKLRKERRHLFEKKITSMIETLEMIKKNRHLIRIKINDHLINLASQTNQVVEDATANIRLFDKEASTVCGKSYDYKPAVETSMMQLAEYGFFWSSLVKLESITNDSVNQIYVPVKYEESQFKSIESEVKAIWPNPEIVEKKVNVPEVQIKQFTELREAHQMLFGFTRPQSIQKALQLYHSEAQKPNCHSTALNALGQIYQSGKFVKKDMNKAVLFYKRSSQKNDPEGLYKVGLYLEKGFINSKEIFKGLYINREAEIRGGIQYYEKAAKFDHVDAMVDLGYIYEKGVKMQSNGGYFIEPTPEHALKYYLKAKKFDSPRGYNNLGVLLITCTSLKEEAEGGNLLKGVKYLEKAVELKYPKAFLNLGKCYQNGVGVSQNIDKARALYLMGAELNDVECKLDYVKSCLGFRVNDETTMVELVRQVLLQNAHNPEALYYMGLFLEHGSGVQKNIQNSLLYVSNAARLDYAPAITKLGDYYFTGLGVKKDYEYAKALYQKAASKGDSKALVNLGVMMEKGIGYNSRNHKGAQELFQEAASMGNPDALAILNSSGSLAYTNKNKQIDIMEGAKLKSTSAFRSVQNKTAIAYTSNLKTLQNFYLKENHVKEFRK